MQFLKRKIGQRQGKGVSRGPCDLGGPGGPGGPCDLGGPSDLPGLVRLIEEWKDGEWRVENMR